jgi:hypothetical protein
VAGKARPSRSDWSAAYRARVERAEAAGKSRQAARGHKAGEHVTRAVRKGLPAPTPRKVAPPPAPVRGKRVSKGQREREEARRQSALGTLSKTDKAYVRRAAGGFAYRTGDDVAEVRRIALDYATRVGIDHFKFHVRTVQKAHKQYLGEANAGAYQSRGPGLLEIWQADDGFPDVRWYYYH